MNGVDLRGHRAGWESLGHGSVHGSADRPIYPEIWTRDFWLDFSEVCSGLDLLAVSPCYHGRSGGPSWKRSVHVNFLFSGVSHEACVLSRVMTVEANFEGKSRRI